MRFAKRNRLFYSPPLELKRLVKQLPGKYFVKLG